MSSISIDLQNDPEIPRGREMFEHLVGAHMAAGTEDELQLLVRYAMEDFLSSRPEHALRTMTHAAYRGQALVVRLLSLATRQRIALEQSGIEVAPGIRQREPERFDALRLDVWSQVRDDVNFTHG